MGKVNLLTISKVGTLLSGKIAVYLIRGINPDFLVISDGNS